MQLEVFSTLLLICSPLSISVKQVFCSRLQRSFRPTYMFYFFVSINEKLKIGKSTETSVSLVYNEVVIGISFKSSDNVSTFIEAIESIKWR